MPTFLLDIYKGWTNKRLKERCRELCHAVGQYEMMIAMMAEYGPQALEHLPEDMRARAVRLNAAYRDDDKQMSVKTYGGADHESDANW